MHLTMTTAFHQHRIHWPRNNTCTSPQLLPITIAFIGGATHIQLTTTTALYHHRFGWCRNSTCTSPPPLFITTAFVVGTQGPRKNWRSHIDASHSRQPLVKGERLVRYEVNAVMLHIGRFRDIVCFCICRSWLCSQFQFGQKTNPLAEKLSLCILLLVLMA